MSAEDTTHEWPGTRQEETKSRAALAPLYGALEAVLDFVPTYRDTAAGRRKSTQMRIALIAVGVFVVGFAGRTYAPIGVIIMALALFVPLAELRKRGLRQRLRRGKVRITNRAVPITLRFDGRRVAVIDDEKVVRRVLTKGNPLRVEEFTHDGSRALCIKGERDRKRDNIWLTSDGTPRSDTETTRDTMDLVITLQDDAIDALLNATESA